MREAFETWAQAEIVRLRGEADALQLALDKYLESQGTPRSSEPMDAGSTIPKRSLNPLRGRSRKGSKRAFVLTRIRESIGGRSTEELWKEVSERFPDMKRSSLRALLYTESKAGNIKRQGERYVTMKEGPGAPTPDPSKLI
ncbi:MAG TPA: hypothetical protein VGG57_18225 [Stellaceae bacterium]|jgi:hypothetical protein